MAETIYLKDGKKEVIFDLEKTLCDIALKYCGEDYEREIRNLFNDISDLKEDIKDLIDSRCGR